MPRTLVTVKGSRHTVDLELPADVPAQELMAFLLTICEDLTPEMIDLHLPRWGLGLDGGMPFNPQQTLQSAGVLDGARLLLHPLGSWGSSTAPVAQLTGPQRVTAPAERQSITIRWGNTPSQ